MVLFFIPETYFFFYPLYHLFNYFSLDFMKGGLGLYDPPFPEIQEHYKNYIYIYILIELLIETYNKIPMKI